MRPISILLVEDNPGDALLIKAGFKRARIANEIAVAVNARDALALLQERRDNEPVDVALFDINLPGMNGIELLREVRADPQLQHLPVVMLTSSDAPRDVREAYQQHANGYVNKPVDIDELVSLIHSLDGIWVSMVKVPTRA